VSKPPFDPVKATFFLIAAIMGVQSLMVIAAGVSCLIYSKTIIMDPAIVCDPKDRAMQLMTNMLATALALLAGFMKGGGPPPPPPSPPKEK